MSNKKSVPVGLLKKYLLQFFTEKIGESDGHEEIQHIICTYYFFGSSLDLLEALDVASQCVQKSDPNFWKMSSLVEFFIELCFDVWRDIFNHKTVMPSLLHLASRILPKEKFSQFKIRVASVVSALTLKQNTYANLSNFRK